MHKYLTFSDQGRLVAISSSLEPSFNELPIPDEFAEFTDEWLFERLYLKDGLIKAGEPKPDGPHIWNNEIDIWVEDFELAEKSRKVEKELLRNEEINGSEMNWNGKVYQLDYMSLFYITTRVSKIYAESALGIIPSQINWLAKDNTLNTFEVDDFLRFAIAASDIAESKISSFWEISNQ